MSSIRIRHGMAEVELEALEMRTAADLRGTVQYPTDDLIAATARALDAAHDARGEALWNLIGGGR